MIVFFVLLAAGFLAWLCLLVLNFFGLMEKLPHMTVLLPLITVVVCITLGTLISAILTNKLLKPLRELIRATRSVAKGDFSIRVPEPYSKNEIGELFRSFNIMTVELGSTELFRNDFIDSFSHEFRTPIVSIRGFAKQLMNDEISPDKRKEYAGIILDESDRLVRLSSVILLLTKFENQQLISDRSEFYLDEQIRHSILILEKKWSAKNIAFNIELSPILYKGNEEMLSHVWRNIIDNAIKFSSHDSEIGIKGLTGREFVEISISDQGTGMDQLTMNHIFDKFFQGDSSRASEGNGLGLTLVKRIVELCGGKVEVESAKNVGTTFTVKLPIN